MCMCIYVTGFGKSATYAQRNIEKYVIKYSKCNILERLKAAGLQFAMNPIAV